MKYTDAQIKAINQGRNPAIVSAGAGSGKTAVLTQRVVRLICDKNENIDPSKIVVVTFTVKAADELKARLDALMRQRINEAVSSADVRFLRNQRMRLRKARISTISSFCTSPAANRRNSTRSATFFPSTADRNPSPWPLKHFCWNMEMQW